MNEADQRLLTPRSVGDSQSEMAEIVLPNDTNPLNALLGGRLMHWIDLAGAMACHRHSRQYVVTASIDHMDFLVPVHVGDLVILVDGTGRHLPVPPVVPETPEQQRRYEDAGRRRELRKIEFERRKQRR
jgi:acyl-CoA hydrolase